MKHDNEAFNAQISQAVGAMDESDAFVLVHFDVDGDGGQIHSVNDDEFPAEEVGEMLVTLLGNHIRYLSEALDMEPQEVIQLAAVQTHQFEVVDEDSSAGSGRNENETGSDSGTVTGSGGE